MNTAYVFTLRAASPVDKRCRLFVRCAARLWHHASTGARGQSACRGVKSTGGWWACAAMMEGHIERTGAPGDPRSVTDNAGDRAQRACAPGRGQALPDGDIVPGAPWHQVSGAAGGLLEQRSAAAPAAPAGRLKV